MGNAIGNLAIALLLNAALLAQPSSLPQPALPAQPTPRAQLLTIYTEIFHPDQFLDPSGQLTGYAVEVVQEIQKRTGHSETIQLVPWARAYHEAQIQPGIVLFSMARSTERNALFEWIGPIKESKSILFVKSDSEIVLDDLEQAKKLQRIGVYKDDARDHFLVKAGFTNLDRSVDQEILLKKLLSGRVDAMAGVQDSVTELLKKAGLQPGSIRAMCSFMNIQIYIVISKGTNPAIIRSWREALEGMRKDGAFQKLYRKYYPNLPMPGPAVAPE